MSHELLRRRLGGDAEQESEKGESHEGNSHPEDTPKPESRGIRVGASRVARGGPGRAADD